jgi:hypothetical protein
MKLSAYFKSQGHTTSILSPDDVLKGQDLFNKPDKLYGAVVFEENKDVATQLARMGVIVGGTGILKETKLAPEVESMYPDYELYGIKDTAYGFLTRGCPRGCKFCIVGKKEGLKSIKVADLLQFWNGQKYIKLLDPNLLACNEWENILQQLIDSKAWIDFTQGLDIRLMTKEKADMINQLKIKMIHFAWDNYEFDTFKKLTDFRKQFKFDDRKLRVYVLTNFNTTHEQDLERVYKLKDAGYDPFVMIFNKLHAPKITKRLARWVDNKFIFRSCEQFSDYK